MSKKRSNRISTLGARLSTIISVSLVLLILGVILIITSLTTSAGDSVRRNMSVVLSLVPDLPQSAIDSLSIELQTAPYTSEVTFISADEVMKQEMKYNSDIINALGQNPYTAEFDITLRAEYVDTDSLSRVFAVLSANPSVEDVYSQTEAVDNLNASLHKITFVLSVIGVIVLVVSVLLLFNTINLSIYSRRFIIHTMQLVGATRGFIWRPFVLSGSLIGLVSGLISSALICLLHYYLQTAGLETIFTLDWRYTAVVCAILLAFGITGCALAACWASSKYLKCSYDTLYTH